MGRIPRIARLLSLVLAMLAVLAVASAQARAANPMPAEGVFEKCPLATDFSTCVNRLSAMSAGGVQVVVVSARGASLDNLALYAATAHNLGMSVMWEIGLRDWWAQPLDSPRLAHELPEFAAACGCQTNQPLFAYFIGWLRALPATYGYYAADDTSLSPGDAPAISAYMARLKQLDPVHPAMIGAYNGAERETYQSMSDLIGQEIYPVTTGPILPAGANQSTWGNVDATVTGAQSSADVAGKSSAFILQAFTWGDNLSDGTAIGACSASDTTASCYARLRYPTAEEQLALRNAVLGNAHPSLILWYTFPGTFGSAAADTGTIYPSGADAASRWSGLSAAIRAPWTPVPASADTGPATSSGAATGHHPRAARVTHRKRHRAVVCRARRTGRHHRAKHHRCDGKRRSRHSRGGARKRAKHVHRALASYTRLADVRYRRGDRASWGL